ncbi:hypothetical protein F5890DRAFT_1525192 [Lentinula detonsa]|uniref:Uncharacterized protein n=1 Tax=Lentinula detonsa TaxID=2804962 RepID=A0AA38PWV8_9AGAR|nr:hypothetical protein F5890DRAFT_1525192 [Lentinula detonsa]
MNLHWETYRRYFRKSIPTTTSVSTSTQLSLRAIQSTISFHVPCHESLISSTSSRMDKVNKRASNVQKLAQENEKLKEELRAMSQRLEAAERRRQELDRKKQSMKELSSE